MKKTVKNLWWNYYIIRMRYSCVFLVYFCTKKDFKENTYNFLTLMLITLLVWFCICYCSWKYVKSRILSQNCSKILVLPSQVMFHKNSSLPDLHTMTLGRWKSKQKSSSYVRHIEIIRLESRFFLTLWEKLDRYMDRFESFFFIK